MKLRTLLAFCTALIAVQCYGQTASGIPRLEKQGTATQLIVDGQPFLALAGELGKQHRHQSREHATDMAQIGFGQFELRAGGDIVGADGTG